MTMSQRNHPQTFSSEFFLFLSSVVSSSGMVVQRYLLEIESED